MKRTGLIKMGNELTDREVKDRLLFVLQIVNDVCEKYNLKYFVYGGTLLGTIRHQGFIPWDDDIDICMPRPDYDKLYDALASNSDVTVFNCDKCDYFTHTYMKVADNYTIIRMPKSKDDGIMGICIDVFPLDALGNSIAEAKKRMNQIVVKRSLATMSNLSAYVKGRSPSVFVRIVRRIVFILSRLIKSNRIHKRINQKAREKKYNVCEYVGSLVDATYREKEIYKRIWFGNGKRVVFENLKVVIPDYSHEILMQLYGDYMCLPPKEKQVRLHEYSAYKRVE